MIEFKEKTSMVQDGMVAGSVVEHDVKAGMRDGTVMYADVYRPSRGDGPWPVILLRQPYDKAQALTISYAHPSWYASQGYLVVSQDTRGRWKSEGEFSPFRHEMEDGYDTVEWAAGLPGSSGNVGMYGFSFGGMTQLYAAAARPPHLACICPGFCNPQMYEGWAYNGGAFALAFNLSWALYLAADTARRRDLPQFEANIWKALASMHDWWNWLPMDTFPLLRAHDLAPYFFDWLEHPAYDAYWQRWSLERHYPLISVPALHIGGWYDIFRDGTLQLFEGISKKSSSPIARENQKLVMGPWCHTPWSQVMGACDLGAAAGNRIDALQLRWFDHWLKSEENGIMEEPRVEYFVIGENSWRKGPGWLPEGVWSMPLYLRSGGMANSLSGDGRLSDELPGEEEPDVYVYDPRAPMPTLGGQSCCLSGISPMGPADQRFVESFNQVLIYSGSPLEEPLTVAGRVETILWAATDVPDTDFTVKMVDVYPDGRAINLTSGILRAQFRESLEHPSLLTPGDVYRFRINTGSTAATFKAGHRVRVEVSSSNFPHWDRNTNSGNNPLKDTYSDIRTATQQVFHDRDRPSHVVLPVIGKTIGT
jgi:putative CocE/NonD family hydrolase